MTTHEVETETIDVEFFIPIFHTLLHETAHHRLFRSRLITATTAVGILSISCFPIVIVGIGALEIGVVDVVGMVIHHVENNSNAFLVQSLHHLLELLDAGNRIVGVGAISTLRHIVVYRVVAPVILVVSETGLINRAIVVRRQDMDGIDTQRLQVLDGPRLGERQELAWILGIRARNGEVAMVKLIDDEVGRRLDDGMIVAAPIVRECLFEIDDGTTLTVDTHRFGEDTRALATTHVEGIETAHEVALHNGCPQPVFIGHLLGLQGFAPQPILIDSYHHLLGIGRSKEMEGSLVGAIFHLAEIEVGHLRTCR